MVIANGRGLFLLDAGAARFRILWSRCEVSEIIR
jgi:hypothetical protein